MSRHRLDPVRPRYGRMAAAGASVVVTAVAMLGGIGLLPTSAGGPPPDSSARATGERDASVALQSAESARRPSPPRSTPLADPEPETASTPTVQVLGDVEHPLPGDSGEGRRVVFSEGQQRVWLVGEQGKVRRTYVVSGSVTDNLQPGSYAVYSRSERAWGIDDSGTMKWFVRFTSGNNAAIGFHDIPVKDGVPLQTVSQLGFPQSHGCIRQREADAKALWRFAPLDTPVVVTA